MIQQDQPSYQLAIRDFQHARKQAVMQQLLARFRGDGGKLLPFNEISQQLHPTGEMIAHGAQEIPLSKIVGSVSRHKDFTRSFLPKLDADQERWVGVRTAVSDMVGMPPIEVYQVGNAYFVQDGNHRVSIARRLGSKTITAYVTEVKTRVFFSADDDPNEIICKAHYADFLAQTNLDKLRPEADLTMTFCGQYHVFLEQISSGCKAVIPNQNLLSRSDIENQAVVCWYDQVFLPVIQIIRDLGILHHFPERTEADMYLLLSERRDQLEKELGWQVEMESGVSDLMVTPMEPPGLLKRVMQSIVPQQAKELAPGLWRQQQLARRRYHHLFKHILMGLDGSDENWLIFEKYIQAPFLTQDHILGLHVVPHMELLASDHVRRMRERFYNGIQRAGIQGEFAVEVGSNPVPVLNKRAAWVDLVVVRGTRHPDKRPLVQTSPELKLLVQQCPRPIEVVPDGAQTDYSRPLLAYDGSPKADEALFIATYFASRWQRSLTVVTVETEYTTAAAMKRAQKYLTEHGVADVNYILGNGPIAETVLETAAVNDCNLLLMGGFSFPSLRNLTLGSSAERILLEFPQPMYICR
ncbi:MAG: universal stress protein [Ardenticatenaceae bacterium]|nr:universal stress protein [Anaerolineales bacterium]MCB8940448.1 universal stress protein [Ardenticatenaceae bacterium]MCB8973464.1 universal stress protein [Ardenticatenaceae bacterium]